MSLYLLLFVYNFKLRWNLEMTFLTTMHSNQLCVVGDYNA